MLTVKGFESSGVAGKYYSHGDYYGSEGTGEWYGKGAEELGLTGEFNAATDPRFKAVLEGRINEDNPEVASKLVSTILKKASKYKQDEMSKKKKRRSSGTSWKKR